MIQITYTGMVLIFCLVNLAGNGFLFWYLSKKILPSINNCKEQNMIDIRSVAGLVNANGVVLKKLAGEVPS